MNIYTQEMLKSIELVNATRESRSKHSVPKINENDKKSLLNTYHPDYKRNEFNILLVGQNKGDRVPKELCELLQGNSILLNENLDLSKPDYKVDVLIIGGGGAGASCALESFKNGANTLIATKLRFGDSNTMMAEGGIQAAESNNDSPSKHFIDALGGGHFTNNHNLLKTLVLNAPNTIKWLENLGVMFDKDSNSNMILNHGGGTSIKRMHSCKDTTGGEIMRVLKDEVLNKKIPILEFCACVELTKDNNNKVNGAILKNIETGKLIVVSAKCVVLATGGAGRLHYQNFPTTNHYGATGDGLILAYRLGAKLIYPDTIQYHPTGVAYPSQLLGALVTEKVRSLGAQLINIKGELFMNPLETRDIASSLIIKECLKNNGIKTSSGNAVWLDIPLIDVIHGKGTIEKKLPNMVRMFSKCDIDITKSPVLVYPTLHYQNGGLLIDTNGETTIENLFAVGEVSGGIHGRNRLMGNSLLDILVFGRIAGEYASEKSKKINFTELNINHIYTFKKELEKMNYNSKISSPILLPDYTRK